MTVRAERVAALVRAAENVEALWAIEASDRALGAAIRRLGRARRAVGA